MDNSILPLLIERAERSELRKQANDLFEETNETLKSVLGDRKLVCTEEGHKVQFYGFVKKAYTVPEHEEKPLQGLCTQGGESKVTNEHAPLPGVMFSVTHQEDGTPIMRESKLLKVGIGLPRGKALNVWITVQDGKRVWKVVSGYEPGKMQTWSFATRQEAEACYNAKIATAPICKYPRKISFFTFSRSVMTEDGETFVPDFAAIEANGPTPTEIDIILFDDNPFTGSFQMWTTTEKKCQGDGINALRVLSMAPPDDPEGTQGREVLPHRRGLLDARLRVRQSTQGLQAIGRSEIPVGVEYSPRRDGLLPHDRVPLDQPDLQFSRTDQDAHARPHGGPAAQGHAEGLQGQTGRRGEVQHAVRRLARTPGRGHGEAEADALHEHLGDAGRSRRLRR